MQEPWGGSTNHGDWFPRSLELGVIGFMRSMQDRSADGGQGLVLPLSSVEATIRAGGINMIRQPVVSAISKQVLYDECLARLRVGKSYISNAADFVSRLDADAQHLLDLHMVNLAARRLQEHRSSPLGVNISLHNLTNARRWAALEEELLPIASADLSNKLILEITETAPWTEPAELSGKIAALRSLGFQVALDDFGIAFASPYIASTILFDLIKIDRKFLGSVRVGNDGRTTLRDLVHFAACFCSTVVVEGVETVYDAQLARESGATHLQGFLFKASAQ